MRYIKVGFPRTPVKSLIYSVPSSLPDPEPGMRVLAPLGPRFLTGFVVDTKVETEKGMEVREIADVIDQENLFSQVLLKLTRWMADYYLAEWADLLKSALPPGLDVKPETMITITTSGEMQSPQNPILALLQEKKKLPLKRIYSAFGHQGTFSQIREMQIKGWLDIIAERGATRRGYNMVEAVRNAPPPTGAREREIYDFLLDQPGAVWIEDLQKRFPKATVALRKMALGGEVRRFWVPAAPKNLWPKLGEIEKLNLAQQQAFDHVRSHFGHFSVFLLHGVTGSGKTEVYFRLAQETLASGKTVLILVPEIALLPLIAYRAEQTLRHHLSILHSELTDRERLEEWQKAKRGEVRLVIGTRSAVFAPLQNVGLIVVDEEQEGAYKQMEYPRYHARESAIIRAQMEGCPIVLGSATPSIETFFNAEKQKFYRLTLPERVEDRPMPEVSLVDMKEEFRTTGDAMFSRLLLQEIEKTLSRGEQILILQNRRGYASLLLCRECGTILQCPQCSVTLTYHKTSRRMQCHYCDYSRLAPSKCELCNSSFLHFFGIGTEKVAEGLFQHFPNAKIERFDRDSTRKRGSIAAILTRFALREIDILVGTQMIAKGHDFPNVTLVGVVGADSAIGIPDFRSSERLFQLLTQVAGRSGRGSEPGRVILQSFYPDHYAIQCALTHSYQCFYDQEIRFRKLMNYPPFVSMAHIVFTGKDPTRVLADARDFARFLLALKTQNMKVLGPALAPIAKISGQFRYHILLKSPVRKALRDCLREAIAHFEKTEKRYCRPLIDIDPFSII